MTVYVDDGAIPFGRMKMAHMIADTTEELIAMAEAIGLSYPLIQRRGTWAEHYDVSQSKRLLAIAAGAVEVDRWRLAAILEEKR